MDSSRRAVESYWRSRMIDGATSDEDKVAPVYKLEEICELLRSSHVSIVKEVSEFILKRLDHKSPIVKQKALRLIKYAVGKSGVEFRREMQRHSTAVRQLLHYKGQPDPLKGDALNKSVRETAQEAISAIFASDDNKPAPAEDLNRRIQGFGNKNYEMPSSDDKKSFFSEVVGIGSASIKQGLSHIAAAHSHKKNDNGSYRSPNLRRSLTTERDPDKYESVEHHSETQSSSSSGMPKNVATGTWGQDSRVNMTETTNGDSGSSFSGSKSREERLLETIVTSGGVRLQPTRDAIQVFLVEASKLDAVALSHTLESKLQSHLWQVRMKAVCVLESILRKKDEEHFAIIASYFSENRDSVVKCSESPQASLREKANKVLSFLDDEQTTGSKSYPENESRVKAETVPVQMPDLIDTGGPDDYYGNEDFTQKQSDNITDLVTSTTPVTDLFGDSLITGLSTSEQKNEDDPFADVSFHTTENKEQVDDLFSGLTVDNKQATSEVYTSANKNRPELVDIFSFTSEQVLQEPTVKQDMNDLMADLSINGNAQEMNQQGSTFSDVKTQQSQPVSNDALNGILGSQMNGMNVNPNTVFPMGTMPYSIPPNMMFNPAFASQPINYGVMGSFLAQQQLLATMSNFQQLGNLNALGNANLGHPAGNSLDGGYPSPLPDIFNPNIPTQSRSTILNNPKKEETKAFDFISDHLSAARDPKRVV
ncbi:Epsin domain [Macleaya cordata]|uniref:Epsin domain n=1 Tax=Macleaya cordata TaxID=56857 RepID=A0A200RC64_MACCD|nr:Epsin domain [Macleaya cordata]